MLPPAVETLETLLPPEAIPDVRALIAALDYDLSKRFPVRLKSSVEDSGLLLVSIHTDQEV